MSRQSLDAYDPRPDGMRKYISNYGWHFNQKACDYAVSLMKKKNVTTGKMDKIEPITKEQLDMWMKQFNITLENDILCDALYVGNMCKAKFFKRSVPDEQHLVMFVRDTIDDPDAADGTIMRKWYAAMTGAGIGVDWEELI